MEIRRSSVQGLTIAFVVLACGLALSLGGGAPARAAAPACPSADKTVDYNCPLGPSYLIPGLTDVNGWNQPAHYKNIFVADLNGDSTDELVVRGVNGIQVYRFDDAVGQWTQMAVNPILPDSAGWDQPKYYSTIRIADIDDDLHAELVARSPNGLVVYRFNETSPDSGTWTQLTTSGPMADKDCFSNGKCWGDDPSYYSTIQIAHDVPGSTLTSVIARGGDGLVTYWWNGSGWSQAATNSDFSDANGWNTPERYTTIRYDYPDLIARGPDGEMIYTFDPDPLPGAWKPLVKSGPFADKDCFSNGKCWTSPEYYSTIQPIDVGFGGGGNPVVMGRAADGVHVYEGASDGWSELTNPAGPLPFTDADGFNKPQYYRTIQADNIDGQGTQVLIGRTPTGMVAYRLLDPGGGTGHWSAPISQDQPALADDPWGKDPSYYETIKTAVVKFAPPAPTHVLLARGPYGIRTWRFDGSTSTWTRYTPYGNFPTLDPTAFAALNTFLGIANGNIRTVYTDPSRTPTPDQLQQDLNAIAGRCTNELSASPPRYQTCSPPQGASGVTPDAWTAVSNQIMAELYWAGQVLGYFSTLEDTNTQLFLDQDSEFPSIVDELKLGQDSAQVVAPVNYLSLFEGIFDVLGTIPVIGRVFEATADALSIADQATDTGSGKEPSEFDHKFSEMQTHIAKIRQEAQDAITFHQHHVLGDYGLLSTVGHLVASQIWTLDEGAALSAGRQAFTLWAYHGLLPVLWDRWTVTGCFPGRGGGAPACQPPGNGEGMESYKQTGSGPPTTDFDGLVPRQSPCNKNFLTQECIWTSLEDQNYGAALKVLRDPVTADCTYDPAAGHSWRYGACSLGIGFDQLDEVNSNGFRIWPFRQFGCAFRVDNWDCYDNQPTSVTSGGAQNSAGASDTANLTIEEPLKGTIDLRHATLTLGRYLNERSAVGAGELVNHPTGEDATPNTIPRVSSTGPGAAVFRTPRGELPSVLAALWVQGGALHGSIQIAGASLDDAHGCASSAVGTFLNTHLVVSDGVNPPVQVLSMAPWKCTVDASGKVRSLQMARVQ